MRVCLFDLVRILDVNQEESLVFVSVDCESCAASPTTPGGKAGTRRQYGVWTRLVANTGAAIMMNFGVFFARVAPSAPSPTLPEAMAGATSMGGYLATARATQLVGASDG